MCLFTYVYKNLSTHVFDKYSVFDFETVRENVKLVILRATRIANFLWPLSTVVGAD